MLAHVEPRIPYIDTESSDHYLARDFVCWLQEAIAGWADDSKLSQSGMYFSSIAIFDHKRVLEASFGFGLPRLKSGGCVVASAVIVRVPMQHPKNTAEGLEIVGRVGAQLQEYLAAQHQPTPPPRARQARHPPPGRTSGLRDLNDNRG